MKYVCLRQLFWKVLETVRFVWSSRDIFGDERSEKEGNPDCDILTLSYIIILMSRLPLYPTSCVFSLLSSIVLGSNPV